MMKATTDRFEGPRALERGGIKIELEDIGEGLHGDYNASDPDDIPLLRFTVYRLEDGMWIQVDDASYCTLLPAESSDEVTKGALLLLMDRLYDAIESECGVKRAAEDMSWIEPGWIQKEAA